MQTNWWNFNFWKAKQSFQGSHYVSLFILYLLVGFRSWVTHRGGKGRYCWLFALLLSLQALLCCVKSMTVALTMEQGSTAAPGCSSCQQFWEEGKAVTAPKPPPGHPKRRVAGVSYCLCINFYGNSHVQQFPRHSSCAHGISFSQAPRQKS